MRKVLTCILLATAVVPYFTCVKKPKDKAATKAEETYLFVDAPSGLNLRDKPNLKSSVLDILPFNTKVTISDRTSTVEIIGGKRGLWVKTKFENNTGWVFDAWLTRIKRPYYFLVKSLDGVKLRSKPNEKSEAIKTVPYAHLGQILTTTKRRDVVGGLRGFWLRTEYKDESGWIFSAFTQTSFDGEQLGWSSYMSTVPRKLDTAPDTLQDYLNANKKIAVVKKGNYDIYTLEMGPGTGCGPQRMLLFHNRTTDGLWTHPAYSEKIEITDVPFKDTVYTYVKGCCECCPNEYERLYFLGQEELRALNLSAYKRTEMSCTFSAMGIEFGTYHLLKMAKGSNRLLIHKKLPKCEYGSLEPENQVAVKDIITKTDQFTHEVFGIIDFSGKEVIAEEFANMGIPEKLKSEWESMPVIDKFPKPDKKPGN